MKNTKILLVFVTIFTLLIFLQSFGAAGDVVYKDKQNDVVSSDDKLVSDPDIDIKEISYTKTDTGFELGMIVYGIIVKDSENVSYAFILKMDGNKVYYTVRYTNNTCQLFKFESSDKSYNETISDRVVIFQNNLVVNVPKTTATITIEDSPFVFEATTSRGGVSDHAGPTPASKPTKNNWLFYGFIGGGIFIIIVIIVIFIRFKPSARRKKVGLETIHQPPGAPLQTPPPSPFPYQVPYPTQQPQSQYNYPYSTEEPYTTPQDMYAPYYKQEPYTGYEHYPQTSMERGRMEPGPAYYQPEQFARCHACGGTIPIPSAQRPVTIVCPTCGVEGVID
jgi:hypothetical protein